MFIATITVSDSRGPIWPSAYGETAKEAKAALNDRLETDFYDCKRVSKIHVKESYSI